MKSGTNTFHGDLVYSYIGRTLTAMDFFTKRNLYSPAAAPVTEEKKKAARDKRKEYMRELQEKIKYGLMEAPPPKVKMNNFMRILANEAAADPTKVELEVKKMIDKRQQDHIERNESRKLTKEQKQEKMINKLKKDLSK